MSFTPPTFDNPQTYAPVKKRRIWPWVVIPVGCLTVMLVCCGGFMMLGFGVMAALKTSEPYQTGLKRAQASAEVKEAIGEPVSPTMIVQGKVDLQNDTGSADISFPVTGPKGTAEVRVIASRAGGAWTYDSINVSLPNGDNVDLTDTP
jgi:hypothetical protein